MFHMQFGLSNVSTVIKMELGRSNILTQYPNKHTKPNLPNQTSQIKWTKLNYPRKSNFWLLIEVKHLKKPLGPLSHYWQGLIFEEDIKTALKKHQNLDKPKDFLKRILSEGWKLKNQDKVLRQGKAQNWRNNQELPASRIIAVCLVVWAIPTPLRITSCFHFDQFTLL